MTENLIEVRDGVAYCPPGVRPIASWPLDQRIGEHLSVVRLGDVPGMPQELHDIVFVIDRTYRERGRPKIGVSSRFPFQLQKAEAFVEGIILAADALRGIVEVEEDV